MRRFVSGVIVLFLVLAFNAVSGGADDAVSLDGEIVCARCTLKVKGVNECQNVLLAKDAEGKETQYWLAAGPAADAFGEVCDSKRPATVVGRVEEKDGRKWIAVDRIDSRQTEKTE